jgi:hypothetical protein
MIYMKKFLLALLAVGSVATANAQKGSWLHYGNVGIATSKTDKGSAAGTDKSISWNINPGVGYQFSKCLTAGVQGGYMSMKSESEFPFIGTATQTILTGREQGWQAGAFLRHTHSFDKTFSVFHQLDVSMLGGKMTTGIMMTPAVSINIHDGFAMNFSVGGIGFATTTWDIAGSKQDVKESGFALTFGQQFNIGVSKNMWCKKKHHHMEPGMESRKHKKHADDDDE